MRRLAARLVIATVALASAGTAAACSLAPGLAYAHGEIRPSVSSSGAASSQAASTSSPAPTSTALASTQPAITVVGGPKGVKAKAGILVDATTGQVLWTKNANQVRPIASITKVMTALVILQAGGLNRRIKMPKSVTAYVAKNDANAAGLVPGQVFTVDNLLHGMLIESAADAAYALAQAYGPGRRRPRRFQGPHLGIHPQTARLEPEPGQGPR